ncbi:putative transporter [Triangularia setosa]|uniref:Transporter n=1 Tax=Triangularia setosa TaxID=2587417 RepID=A0AAN6W037_9PEZI|nr:putative transporter [Podospora setosa]
MASLGTSVLRPPIITNPTPTSSRPGTSSVESKSFSALSSTPDLTAVIAILPSKPDPTFKFPPPFPSPPQNDYDEPPYSAFSPRQKLLLTLLVSFAAMFSTLSSFIYYPALVPLSQSFSVSLSLIQLTITSYLVVAGIAPAFMGDMADQSGRRPVYMLMFLLMISANVGIAMVEKWEGLLVLRMMQSAGGSGLYGGGYGVIADIAGPEERGGLVGVLLLMTDVATSLGPVIGGGLTEGLGWRWIFWFLVILTGSWFVVILLFLPETQRRLVGDGSKRAKGWVYRSFWSVFYFNDKKGKMGTEAIVVGEKMEGEGGEKRKFRFPNPLACFPVLADKGSLVVILITAINYAVKAALQTSLDAQATEIYRLSYLQAGLVYLPSGVGGGFGSFLAGRFIDWNYKRTVEKGGQQEGYDKNSPSFPLEQTRLRGIYTLHTVTVLGIIGYGLALKFRAHLAVTLVMQLLTGTSTAATFVLCGTLLTDLNLNRSATAQAASNLVRCLSAGGAVAVLQPLVEHVGPAACFGIYAGIVFLCFPLALVVQRFGVEWRVDNRRKNT